MILDRQYRSQLLGDGLKPFPDLIETRAPVGRLHVLAVDELTEHEELPTIFGLHRDALGVGAQLLGGNAGILELAEHRTTHADDGLGQRRRQVVALRAKLHRAGLLERK